MASSVIVALLALCSREVRVCVCCCTTISTASLCAQLHVVTPIVLVCAGHRDLSALEDVTLPFSFMEGSINMAGKFQFQTVGLPAPQGNSLPTFSLAVRPQVHWQHPHTPLAC